MRPYIDGAEKVCGTSWENYYRFGGRNPVTPSDRLMWRLSTPVPTGAPSLLGKGFLFDSVTSNPYQDNNPVACPPNVGPTGGNGRDGTDGKDGKTARTVPIAGMVPLSLRILVVRPRSPSSLSLPRSCSATRCGPCVSVPKGAKFLGAKATLCNKRLPVRGRTIKVDLGDKTVGNYNVLITTKHKKGGKSYTVRSV